MRRAGLALAVSSTLGLAVAAAQHRAPLVPAGGGPIDPGALPASVASCEGCHTDEAAHFAGSMHARAAIDPIFLAEYAPHPDPSCVGCHAPLAPEGSAIDDASARAGVGCIACHVREGRVLTSRAPTGRAPHDVLEEPRLRTIEACASCHQFRFAAPVEGHAPHFDPAEAQQDTVTEWRAAHARACQSCHMAGVSGEAHRFPGAGDSRLLASALDVRVRARQRDDAVDVTLVMRATAIGHAMPTGDLFRRLRVGVTSGQSEAHDDLRRVFAPRLAGERFVVGEVDDTRLQPGRSRTLHLRLADVASVVDWSVVLWRLDPAIATARAIPDSLARSEVLRGSVEVARSR